MAFHTTADSLVVLFTVLLPPVTRLPWQRKPHRAAERHWSWKDDAARKVPAQRRVAGLLAWPAPGERSARGGTNTTEPASVSHMSAHALRLCALPARVTTPRRTCVLRPDTSGATGLVLSLCKRPPNAANYLDPAAALAATQWSALIKRR
ncbi:hypothetical protein NN561_011035 [Cricetulus griseus]